jgi:hypothetical protein
MQAARLLPVRASAIWFRFARLGAPKRSRSSRHFSRRSPFVFILISPDILSFRDPVGDSTIDRVIVVIVLRRLFHSNISVSLSSINSSDGA